MKIKYKLLSIFLIFSAVIISIMLINNYNQKEISLNFDHFATNTLPGIISLNNIEPELLKVKHYALKYSETNNSKMYEKTKISLRKLLKHTLEHEVYHNDHDTEEDLQHINKIIDSFENYIVGYLILAKRGADKEELYQVEKQFEYEFEQFELFITPLIATEINRTLKKTEQLKQEKANLRILSIGLFLFGLLITALLSFAVMRSITSPIKNLLSNIESINKGDFSSQIDTKLIHSKDEIGILATSFHMMAKNLNKITASKIDLEKEIIQRKQAEKQLINSEQQFRTLVEQAPISIQIFDPTGLTLNVNKAWEKLWQTTAGAKLIGKYNALKDKSMQGSEWLELFKKAFAGQVVELPDLEYNPADIGEIGRKRIVRCLAFPIINDEIVEQVVLIHQDITDRKEAEEKIFANEKELSATLHSIGDGVIATDKNGKITRMNFIAEKLTGWKIEAAKGKELTEIFKIVNAKTGEKVENPVCQVLKTGEIIGLIDHTKLISKDGEEYQIADSAAPIIDSKNKLIGVVLVFRDVTKEYSMRKDLEESEQNLRSVFNAAQNVAFIKTDLKGKDARIIEFSPGAEIIFGYKREEIIGKPAAILHIKEDVKKFPQVIKTMKENKKGFEGESILVKKSGETFPALFTTHPVFDGAGKMIATIGVSIDISKRKEAEDELQKIAKLKSIGTLAGGIAHDFNNILTGIYGNISLARISLSSDHKSNEYLEKAEKSMNRAIKLTKQLLTFAKGGTPVKENVNLSNIIHETVEFDLSGSNVKPIFKETDELWNTEVDKWQMGQVFSNLTINANQASPDGGNLYITLENTVVKDQEFIGLKQGKYVKITVQDQGIGIDKKYLNKIFDPYFTTKQTGNGLGLATTYSIIQKHNGHIEIESELGKGTTFTIYLPASDSPQIKTEKTDTITPLKTTNRQAKVLIMDDEEIICAIASEMIKNIGFTAETVLDGENAIKYYRESLKKDEPFDIIIMDLTIPGGMGGKEAVKQILKINPKAKVIVSSGYSEDPIIANFANYGFSGVITKPYTILNLKEVLTEIINKDQTSQ